MDRQKTRLTVKVSLVFTIYMETNTSKTFYCSTSDKNCPADFITRKIETLGSIFSNETRFCEAACVFYYYDRKSIRILQRVVD